ncbi:MAG TPA: hypothetical protein VM120_07785 [Bryobacteraceae bacterium]|nr:hypothetical protein [Bryobacteraceae bacterium]
MSVPRNPSRRRCLAASTVFLSGCWKKPKPGFSGYAFVANEEGYAIAAVDLSAFAVVRHIHLEAAPTQLISHSARQMVYALTPATGVVHEISRAKLARERAGPLGGAVLDIRLSSGGEAIWALMRDAKQLVELPLDTLRPARRIALPQLASGFDLSLEQPRAMVSFGPAGAAGVVDLQSGKVRMTDCGSPIGTAIFRKDGLQCIAPHRDKKLLTVLDTVSGRVVVRLPLAMRPDHLCYNSNKGQLFVTGQGSDAVAIVFPYRTEVAETVLSGSSPAAMAASPLSLDSPEFLFVTNPRSNQVTILDIENRKVVAVAQVGAEPSHVTITPNNQYALVLNQRSGDMAVIRIEATAKRSRFPAALFTMIPVGSKPVTAVVQAV